MREELAKLVCGKDDLSEAEGSTVSILLPSDTPAVLQAVE